MHEDKDKLIIFDLDGTLYCSETSFFPALNKFISKYVSPSQTERILNEHGVRKFIGEPEHVFINWLAELFPREHPVKMKDEFSNYELAAVQRSGQLYPGVLETLGWLKANNYEIYICSNATPNYLRLIVEKFRLNKFFHGFYIPRSKQESKNMMMDKIKVNAGKKTGYAVGDRIHDLQAAHQNDLFFFGANYGYAPQELTAADKHIIEIRDIIETLK